MSDWKLDFILAGVGGQGTILSSDILVQVGLEAGYDVKKSEVHGMSQRGGGVESHVRWGSKIYSPLAEKGSVDYLLGFEMIETVRWNEYLAPGGTVLFNRHKISPPAVNLGQMEYPSEEKMQTILEQRAKKLYLIEATAKAKELGNPALAGVIMLGTLSVQLEVDHEIWLKVISELVPERFVELNKEAFQVGRDIGEKAS